MLSLTSSAKEKLKNTLQEAEKKEENSLIRIERSSNDPQQLGFLLDTEKEGDQVIRDSEGEKLLLIGQDVAPMLVGLELDYGDTGQGMRFTITHT
jgi:Fe-S cluster assembly iron-binding protein IscA